MARTFSLHAEQLVPRDLETTFAFFADAGNLQRITPPWLDFTVTSELPIIMRPGAIIEYKLKVHGIPIRWRSVVSHWDPPREFVDEQVHGPYTMWHHRHRFTETPEGTLVEDEVRYRVPGGALANLFVQRDLSRIFSFRQQALLHALEITSPAASSLAFGSI